ncbi:MAG: hypothetical protein NXH88_15860 [Hyphomonas sp.]|nr:hypothetical protein [Hyphomonas sp.]
MATIFNLLKPSRWLDERFFKPTEMTARQAELDENSAFLSERGMILIACVLFCGFVWSGLFLWLFG